MNLSFALRELMKRQEHVSSSAEWQPTPSHLSELRTHQQLALGLEDTARSFGPGLLRIITVFTISYIHTVTQPSPPSLIRTSSSAPAETLSPSHSNAPLPYGTHHCVSRNLATLGAVRKWKNTVFVLRGLASFARHSSSSILFPNSLLEETPWRCTSFKWTKSEPVRIISFPFTHC